MSRPIAADQAWFEMREIRKKHADEAVWVPLRVNHTIESRGKHGESGFHEEFLGLTSMAVAVTHREAALALERTEFFLRYSHRGEVIKGQYVPADVYTDYTSDLTGVYLVLDQDGNGVDPSEWHLHHDVVIALGLKREDDTWVAMNEGYVPVARLKRDKGKPCAFVIRAEHLKDYLCARGMGLLVTSYRSRQEIVEDASHIEWPDDPFGEESGGDRWEGRVTEIHEGGSPFGSTFAVLVGGRTGISGEDVPIISPTDESITHASWMGKHKGRKLIRVQGELWCKEWVTPAAQSPRVRRDKLAPSVNFLTDNAGTRENRETLVRGGRWLWFRPGVIMELAHARGGGLRWHSKNMGSVGCSPGSGVDFGVNELGLVTVYAKDIALLPDWQQRRWAGFNISPDGGVGEELFSLQAKGIPADTQAPETFLPKAIEQLDQLTMERFGFRLFREHEEYVALLARTHRFRSIDKAGFFSLAKDIARLTADSIDVSALHKIVAPPHGERWGSLKSLEKVLALNKGPEEARRLLAPLVGAYELRHGDAHLPSSDVQKHLRLVRVDTTAPLVLQGYQLLDACVAALSEIAGVLKLFTEARSDRS